MYAIANVSFGKDSTAMLWMVHEEGLPLDEVVFYDTGAEFGGVYAERDRMRTVIESWGVRYTELRPREPFFFSMLARPVKSRKSGETRYGGYGWCGGLCRWGTKAKTDALDRLWKSRGAGAVYVGIAADETERIGRERAPVERLPLVDAGMSEAECLKECERRGCTWDEGGCGSTTCSRGSRAGAAGTRT